MKNIFIVFLLALSIMVQAQNKPDSIQIAELLADDYETMGTWNTERHIQNCTADYLLIENGEIWDMEKEKQYYISNLGRVITRKNYFDFKTIKVFETTAYAVYTLKSDITEKKLLTTKNWNESVFFRKVNNTWKIELIHSSLIPEK